jgi:hypothetical protein
MRDLGVRDAGELSFINGRGQNICIWMAVRLAFSVEGTMRGCCEVEVTVMEGNSLWENVEVRTFKLTHYQFKVGAKRRSDLVMSYLVVSN